MCRTQPPSSKLDFSKESYLDHSTHLGSPLSIHTHQTSWKYLDRGQRCARKRNLKRAFWRQNPISGSNFDKCHLSGDLPVYDRTKIQENRWVICNSTPSIATFKPTLPTAQRHSAVTQAIYIWETVCTGQMIQRVVRVDGICGSGQIGTVKTGWVENAGVW